MFMRSTKVAEGAKPKKFTKVGLCKEISNATIVEIERKMNDLLEYASPSMLYAHQAHHQQHIRWEFECRAKHGKSDLSPLRIEILHGSCPSHSSVSDSPSGIPFLVACLKINDALCADLRLRRLSSDSFAAVQGWSR
jgi:predicted MarR family transcription regulator